MKKIAFVKSDKKFEDRVAILPEHLGKINHTDQIFIEKNYATHLGISDSDYIIKGANIVDKKTDLLKMDVIVDPKIGDATYINDIAENTTIFGYFHAVQNKKLTDTLIQKKSTCYAWEDLNSDSYHLFSYNNRLAGYASVVHSSTKWKRTFANKKAAIVGKGNTAMGAYEALIKLGADVTIYDRRTETKFIKEKYNYDIIVISVLWDIQRDDYLLYEKDLSLLKKGCLVIDISCDIDGAIEFSTPQTLNDCVLINKGIYIYSLSNSPSVYAYDASIHFGDVIVEFINELIDGNESEVLINSKIIDTGVVTDNRINTYQGR